MIRSLSGVEENLRKEQRMVWGSEDNGIFKWLKEKKMQVFYFADIVTSVGLM